jgi:hypothetical protein
MRGRKVAKSPYAPTNTRPAIQEISTQNSPGTATVCSNLHYAKQSSAPEIFIMPGGNNKKKIQKRR